MNKFLKDFFTTTHNERIGFLCILAIMVITLCYSALTPYPTISDDETAKLAAEFKQALDSSQVDTIKKKRKRKAKQDSVKTTIITINDFDETETF